MRSLFCVPISCSAIDVYTSSHEHLLQDLQSQNTPSNHQAIPATQLYETLRNLTISHHASQESCHKRQTQSRTCNLNQRLVEESQDQQ